ncbi:hypothetical protein N9A62_04060 [Akkermansiaceae bacterium]|nr:hypothetical protein [Akkermansiaceae bacterium]
MGSVSFAGYGSAGGQPGYHGLQKWLPVLADPARGGAARKKAVVAIARQLAVDLWRVFTGQTTAENVGLVYLPDGRMTRINPTSIHCQP